jgi:hypothetical protein
MLRKVMWSVLHGALRAASTMVALRLASKIWQIATGEEPPTKK